MWKLNKLIYLKCISLKCNYPDTLIASTMWGMIHIAYYADEELETSEMFNVLSRSKELVSSQVDIRTSISFTSKYNCFSFKMLFHLKVIWIPMASGEGNSHNL